MTLFVLAVVLLLGGVVIAPGIFPAPALASEQTAFADEAEQPAVWVLPPTWTPSPPVSPTPTVTLIERKGEIPWATAPQWDTPIAPLTPLADQLRQRPMVIGHSVQGRPLEVYRFGQGPSQRVIIAGIHGGYEWNTISLADELIAHLRKHPEMIPAHISLYLLRSLNPDGEAAGRGPQGHNNAKGVDLNRNWEAHWRSDWPRYGCYRGPVSAGAHPSSEPETQALMAFLVDRRIEALVSYHSAAPGIYPSGDPPHPESQRLAEFLAQASGYPYPGPSTGCVLTGTLVDWAYQELAIAAVDVELSNHMDTEFEVNLLLLTALVNWLP